MNVLFCASEGNPFAASGGLGDVAGSLPKALVQTGVDCRVVLPLYSTMKFRDELEYVTNFSVPVGWRSQYCGLFTCVRDGVTFYFLDNEYYFKRASLYGFYDDGERYAFFSRACLEMLFYTDFEYTISVKISIAVNVIIKILHKQRNGQAVCLRGDKTFSTKFQRFVQILGAAFDIWKGTDVLCNITDWNKSIELDKSREMV